MSWWGKAVGGAIGLIIGGPLGAALGVALGHQFDHGFGGVLSDGDIDAVEMEKIQAAFFTATFSVMGHLARADGRVSEDEIEMARRVMRQMRLDDDQRRVAIRLFNEGKQPGFDLDGALRQFRQVAARRSNLLQMFLEIQAYAAYADGLLHPAEEQMLRHLFHTLGFSPFHYEIITARVRAEMNLGGRGGQWQGRGRPAPAEMNDRDAYALLGLDPSADDRAVKKAYRRLMNQHHPDKLVAKGMPEEMLAMATEKTRKIRAAYDHIRARRGG